ncbi:dihydrofolate reductase family protein [Streptomyces thermogriseus]|uniref:Dihydrofolate reductase family protein n=1 Tax=Streptomyces thermogriseus TaxID=75292 RepID=A0ABN1SRQ9_9ACTN
MRAAAVGPGSRPRRPGLTKPFALLGAKHDDRRGRTALPEGTAVRKLTYFIACSIDGFIGDPSGDASMFLPFVDEEYIAHVTEHHPETLPTHGRRALGIDALENKRFDTVVQGRGSYEVALKEGITSPYGHLRQYVASRTLGESPDPDVEIISTDLPGRIRELKAEDGEFGIYLCGGSGLAGELADEIDELVVKTYPVVLGSGMPMFGSGPRITEFALGQVRTFGNGTLIRTYRRKR